MGHGAAEQGVPGAWASVLAKDSDGLFSHFHRVSCFGGLTLPATSHSSSPASKDGPSLIHNVQKRSDLISIWVFSGLKRVSSFAG